MKLGESNQLMSQWFSQSFIRIGPKIWFFYYWPIFQCVSFFLPQTLLWTKFKNEYWKNARKPHKFYTCLCQVVHIYNTPAQSHKAEKQSKAASCVLTMTNEKRRPMVHLLWFYLRDNHLHLLLPLAFFIGLFEAFMAKEFIMVSQNTTFFYCTMKCWQFTTGHANI